MNAIDTYPSEARRVHAFAKFFKNYMSVSALVVAALPIPFTALDALPVLPGDKAALSLYSSLFCFLTLGLIFSMRHPLARWMYPQFASTPEMKCWSDGDYLRYRIRTGIPSVIVRILPPMLIILSGYFLFAYDTFVDFFLTDLAYRVAEPIGGSAVDCRGLAPYELTIHCEVPTKAELLAKISYIGAEDYENLILKLHYVLMFVSAEAAFILMAMREYIQDLLKVSDVELIVGRSEKPNDDAHA